MPSLLHETLISSAAMRAIFDDQASLRAMLAFEAGLARAQEAVGIVPHGKAAFIADAARPENFDIPRLAAEAARAGALAIPLVKHLTALVSAADATAAGYVHFGATSQDVADTGLVLQIRAACDLLESDLNRLSLALAGLTERHRATPVLGRTLMQPGPPVTLGLKSASWLLAVIAGAERLRQERARAVLLQFGGAVGTLSVFGDQGLLVSAELGHHLDLPVPPMPWHTRRDGFAGLAAALGILTGSLGKMGRDIALMMQFELSEVAEPGGGGRGGSSAMPHKRNPVACMIALGVATRAPGLVSGIMSGMSQELERALGGWQAEPSAMATLFELTHASVLAMIEAIEGLIVDEAAMVANIERLDGLIFAERLLTGLAPHMGRAEAHHLVEGLVGAAIKQKAHLRTVALTEPKVLKHLTPELITGLFAPEAALGSTSQFIDAALAAYTRGS